MRIIYPFFYALPLIWLIISQASPAQSASMDLYTVRGVEVSATAGSAVEARQAALRAGQVKALARLIDRLTAEKTSLPGHLRSAARVKPAVIGFDVRDEKLTATSYAADLSVVFDRKLVLQMLREMGKTPTESRAAPALVFPRLQTARSHIGAVWLPAWRSAGLSHETAPLILPSNAEIQTNGYGSTQWSPGIESLTRKYGGATSVIFVDGDILEKRNEVEISLVAIRVDQAGMAHRLSPVSVKHALAGSASERQAELKKAIRRAARQLSDSISIPWRRSTKVVSGSGGEITASILFSSIEEWQSIRNSLSRAALIRGAKLEGLSVQGAQMKLRYAGTLDQVERELAAHNLRLSSEQMNAAYPGNSERVLIIETKRGFETEPTSPMAH